MAIQAGQTWEKKSFPVPTIVKILAIEGDQILLTNGRRSSQISVQLFLDQGFAMIEEESEKTVAARERIKALEREIAEMEAELSKPDTDYGWCLGDPYESIQARRAEIGRLRKVIEQ